MRQLSCGEALGKPGQIYLIAFYSNANGARIA